MRVVDLSMPIEEGHIRWPVVRGKKGSFSSGDLFEVSCLQTTCHGYTHVDAPSHMVPGGRTLSDLDLHDVVGQCQMIDLAVEPETAIDAKMLAHATSSIEANQILLLRTCWHQQQDYRDEAFWRQAPFLTRDACEWLLERQPTALAVDFPQDWSIRKLLDSIVLPIEEHVSHDVLLRNNVTLIEYLTNTDALRQDKFILCAQPLSLPGADGAPARVVAIETDQH